MDKTMWTSMFQLGLPLLEKMIRPVIVYLFLIVVLRLAGKREMAQLNPFDLVVLLTLSNTVQNAIIGNDNSVSGGLIGAATLLIVNYIVVRLLYNHERLERIVEGAPDVLIEHGEIRKETLKKELVTMQELELAAHKQGFDSLEEVERAVLDPGGAVSFTRKKPPIELSRHEEVLAKFAEMSAELARLREAMSSSRGPANLA